MTDNRSFFQRLTSGKSIVSFVVILFLICAGLNVMPNPSIASMAVPTFLIGTGAMLGLRFIGRLFMGSGTSSDRSVSTKYAPVGAFESAKDPKAWLRSCDARKMFVNEVDLICQTYERIKLRENFFAKYDAESPFTKSYDLIKAQVLSDIKSSGQFISVYHPSSSTDKTYLYDLIKNSRRLATQLDQLVEEAIANQSVADDVDTTYVDDLLKSLEELKAQQVG